jgi:hypothetical protein
MTDETLPPLPPHRLGERWPHHVVWGYEDMVAFARAAILLDRQQRAAPSVPAGWRLVPVEPTGRQLDYAMAACSKLTPLNVHNVYRAMLAVAPPAPSAEPVAWVDERAVAWLEGHPRGKITTQLEGRKTFERPMPLYAAPPPTPSAEPQAVEEQSAKWLLDQCEEYQRRAHEAERQVVRLRAALEGKR